MRPYVTLTYAQSLDGCIAHIGGGRAALSGSEALQFTHQLRASHDALLVGVGTVITDNPSLTVRFAQGAHPQPVVLDSNLRTPDACRLVAMPARAPWLIATAAASREAQARLEARGARVVRVRATDDARVDLHDALEKLCALGVRRLMVEGGAAVITSFLSARLVDRLIVTISPQLLVGLNAIQHTRAMLPRLEQVQYRALGRDWILEADTAW